MTNTHKFGIKLPKEVAKTHNLDNNNANTLWANEITKEMKNMKNAFDIMPDGERVPNGYNQIRCYMIFDVKMEDFRSKVRLVYDGYMDETTK